MSAKLTVTRQANSLARPEAAHLAAAENGRFVDLVQSLAPEDWSKPTDCPAWNVQQMVSHVLAAMEGNASLPEFIHQFRAGKKAAGDRPHIDGITEVQVRERAQLSAADLTKRIALVAPRAARARQRVPAPLRRMPMKVEVGGKMETWLLGYLMDVIFTRDIWMHRVDISRATGCQLLLTTDHDGRIVEDVVAEWARRHGHPFTLNLEGPAGGVFSGGHGGEEITLDAVEFCRIISGRDRGSGLLAQEVPF